MQALILSYFDMLYGPRIFFKAPQTLGDEELNQIPTLIDLYEKGFFVHTFGNCKSVNLIFDIPSEFARGKRELLLITIVIDINKDLNYDITREILEGFVSEVRKIDDVYKAFYVNHANFQGDSDKMDELWNLFYSFFQSFPKENVILKTREAKVFIYGLSLAGKTTIIKTLQKNLFQNPIPTTNVDISRIIINNMSLMAYDAPGQSKFRSLWFPYLRNQDGLVFVLDIAEPEKFEEAKQVLHKIAKISKLKGLPLLVIYNKIDLKNDKLKTEKFDKILELSLIDHHPYRSFLTSALKNEGLKQAFEWLADKISEKLIPSPEIDVGLIFSKWNEENGLDMLGVYPLDGFEDPELIAVRCFSVSQYVFGGANFKRISVILPFTHLKSKASIYFDYVVDQTIRGGILPLSLVIFYNERIPTAIINQFNLYVFEQFAEIKANYEDIGFVKNKLKELHKNILNKLKDFKQTVEALRIAELRYQALFKAARDAILLIDRKSGIIIDANEQAEKLLLKPLEEMLGLHSSQIKLDRENVKFMEEILKQILIERPHRITIKNSNGDLIPVEINANELKMGGQNLLQCILRDITERVKSEQKIKASEKKYRYLFQNSPFGIILLNLKGIVIDCNPAMEKLFGYKKYEIIDKNFAKLGIVDPQPLLELLKRLKEGAINHVYPIPEVKLKTKAEKTIWASIRSTLIQINGETYIQIIGNDVTEKKEADQFIKNRLRFEKIKSLLSSRFVVIKDINAAIEDSLSDMGSTTGAKKAYIFFFDREIHEITETYSWAKEKGSILIEDLKKMIMDTLVWWKNQLVDNTFKFFSTFSQLPERFSQIREFVKEHEIHSILIYPIMIRSKIIGFMLFEDIMASRGCKAEDIALLSIFSEILGNYQEKRLSEEDLKESEQRFHKAYDRANFYKQLFAYDMNDILTNIESALEMYSIYEDDPEKQKISNENVIKIKKNSIDGLKLISNIQKLTKIEESNFKVQKTEVINILERVIEHIRTEFSDRLINIEILGQNISFFVLANEMLYDAFENILIYNLRYNEKDAVNIEIEINQEKKEGINYIKIAFNDRSLQYDQEITKEKMLKTDQEMGKNFRGALLGLSLVEQVISRYNGHIWVEGSKFIIYIPEVH